MGDTHIVNHEAREDAKKREEHHCAFHDPDRRIGGGVDELGDELGIGRVGNLLGNIVDARDDERKAEHARADGAADLVDEGLNGEGNGFVSLTELPLAVFHRIGKEKKCQQLNERLREE